MPPDENPYVGPRPFEAGDAELFFGRDREVRDLVALILSNPVVLLYAASGAGKSSLLNAAVIGRLERDQQFDVLPVARVRGLREQELEAGRNVFVAAVLSHLTGGESSADSLRAYLGEREHRETPDGFPAPRALVIDQLEELFTAYPERWEDRPVFFEDLGGALRDDPLLRVVLSIREDFLAQLDPYARLLPDALRARYRLERLGPGAALRAAKEPARAAGRPFADGVAEQLVQDLQKVRLDTEHGPKEVVGEYVEPVQLQVACRSLWGALPEAAGEITEAHREQFGNVDEVLGDFYDEAIRAAATAGRMRESALRARFAERFITPMGTRGTVFWTREEAGGIPAAAIDELDARHLVRAELRAGARWYELTHDRLIEPVRASNREFESRRRQRRRRRAFAGVATVALAAAAVAAAALATSKDTAPETHPTARSSPRQAAKIERLDRRLAAARGQLATALARTNQGALAAAVPAPVGEARSVTYTSGGKRLLVVGARGTREWTTDGMGVVARTTATTATRPVASATRGEASVTAFADGRIVLSRGSGAGEVVGRIHEVASIALSPDAKIVVAGDLHGGLEQTSSSGAVTLSHPGVELRSPAFGRSATEVVYVRSNGYVIRDRIPIGGSVNKLFRLPAGLSGGIAVSANGNLVAAFGTGRAIALLDTSGNVVGAFPGGDVTAAAFSPSGDRLATGHGDGKVRIWRTLADLAVENVRVAWKGRNIEVTAEVRNAGGTGAAATFAEASGARVAVPALKVAKSLIVRFVVRPTQPIAVRVGRSTSPEQSYANNVAHVDYRARVVAAAVAAARHPDRVRYAATPPAARLQGLRARVMLPNLPKSANSSSFATWCYWQAVAPDPNGLEYGNAGSDWLVRHGRAVSRAAAKPGDLVFYISPEAPPAGRDPERLTGVYLGGARVVTFRDQRLQVIALDSVGWKSEIRSYLEPVEKVRKIS